MDRAAVELRQPGVYGFLQHLGAFGVDLRQAAQQGMVMAREMNRAKARCR
jgi:hypothetical protein